MRTVFRKAWTSRAPRERSAIIVLIIVLTATLYLWLITSSERARAQLRLSVPVLRADMRDFEQHALEYDRLRAFPSPPLLPEDLRVLVQNQAEAAGISDTLALVDAADTSQVHVAFSAVRFADWLSWVEEMQLKHLRFQSGRIEGRPEPGMVDVAATFVRDSAE